MAEGVRVIIESVDNHPICEHGPALLFERNVNKKCQRFYACSAYRDQKECSLHIDVDQFEPGIHNNDLLLRNAEVSRKMAHDSSNLLEKILSQRPEKRIYCHTCKTFIEELNFSKHKDHAYQKAITNEQIQRPTTFLRSLSNDKREAQYFFSDSTLQCLIDIFQQLQINKIVCIGAPRLHETLKTNHLKLNIKSILLDLDTRFYSFYNRGDENDYFHYNMFNNYFFAGDETESKFYQFLRNEKNDRCCIFTDPPFGCRTEPLVHTLRTLSQKYCQINNSHDILPIFWVFPYFMEVYITNVMPEMEMLDYKIDYTNHETYHAGQNGRKQGSPVRLFTNVPLQSIVLPVKNGYRFCRMCKKWVAHENRHCDRCKKCPSKNGATYVHCKLCELCVKPTYKHCNNCWRCTQIEHHECAKYQSHLKCTICLQKGHNELNCHKWFKICKKNSNEITKMKSKMIKTGRRICFLCFRIGHCEQFCLKRSQILNETSFLNQCYNLLTVDSL